jgi:hypothetical protein
MKINEFCERLYDKKEQQPSKSVGVSKEMREFIASELARANEEALRLKQDEIERQKDEKKESKEGTTCSEKISLFGLVCIVCGFMCVCVC